MTKKKNKKKKSYLETDEKEKKSNLPLVLSVLAILISLGQFILTIPIVLKYFDRVEIRATQLGLSKPPDKNYVRTTFLIKNIGKNTAEDVELHLRILKGDNVLFIPEVFRLSKDDKKNGVAKNLIYKCEELVPGELVRIYVYSDFDNYLKINSIDTLIYGKTIARPEFDFGPYISNLKYSKGLVSIKTPDSLTLKEIKYLN